MWPLLFNMDINESSSYENLHGGDLSSKPLFTKKIMHDPMLVKTIIQDINAISYRSLCTYSQCLLPLKTGQFYPNFPL